MKQRITLYRHVKMIATAIVAAWMYASSHNERIIPPPHLIISQEWMLAFGALAAALISIGASMSSPPQQPVKEEAGEKDEQPANGA